MENLSGNQSLINRLKNIIRSTDWLYEALYEVKAIHLSGGCIGAGAIRNAVWDSLHGYDNPSFLSDIDVAYFDPSDITDERDKEIQALLSERLPNLNWEVTNQAGVHIWFEKYFGHSVEPLTSIEDAIASWPETATSIAAFLDENDNINIIAPFGLQDLFDMVIRRNTRRVSIETYRERIHKKKYNERWPKVKIISE